MEKELWAKAPIQGTVHLDFRCETIEQAIAFESYLQDGLGKITAVVIGEMEFNTSTLWSPPSGTESGYGTQRADLEDVMAASPLERRE